MEGGGRQMAGTTGLEPATSDVTGRRSNQLNYVPAILAPRICGARQVGDFQHNTCSRSATPHEISVLISCRRMLFLPPRPRMSACLDLTKFCPKASRLE